MDNIRVKQESLSDWRSQFEIEEGKKKGLDGKACWDGYKLSGTKKKGGKTVDNCVKEDQVDEGVGALIKTGVAAYGLYKGGQWLKKKGDEALENARQKSKIGGEYRRKQIEKNTGVKLEQIEGGISVQNYADGVQFTEIETVDIIKAEPLNPSNWRNDLDILGEGNRTKGYTGSGNKKDYSKGPNEAAPVDYRYLVKNDEKKETVSASHEVEGDLVDEGLVRGAIQGAGLLWKFGKWAIPKAARALKNKGATDINKFKKSQELVKRVNNIEKIRASKSLKGTDVKGIFTKSKVKPGLNKVNWQATVPVTRAVSTTSSRLLSPASNTTTAHKIATKLTKVKRQQITSRATEVLDQIKRGKKLQGRIDKAVSTSNKPNTLSQRTDELIARIRADKGSAIVKSQRGSLATQKSRALTKLQNKSSSITTTPSSSITRTPTKTPNTRASNATVDVKATTVKPKSLSPKPTKPYSAKREYAKDWMRYNKAADATLRADKASKIANVAGSGLVGLTVGGKVGQELGKPKDTTKDLSIEKDKKELDTLKKQDNIETPKETPKETPEVIKSSPKDRSSTEDSEKAAWLHKTRNSPAAKSGAFTDDERWNTQKKHRKWKASRKKKKEVSEGVAAVASKLPWGKIAGAAMTAVGGAGVLQTVKDNILPDGDPPSDVQKELDQPQVVKKRSEGGKLLDKLLKKPTVRQRAADDAIENSKKDDAIYDASELKGTEKTKRMLEIARKYNKKNKDKK